MTGHDNLGIHLRRTGDGFVKVVDLKPQQNTIAIRLVVRIADRSVVVIDLNAVQLQDQPVIRHQSLIFRAAVRALAPEQTLVPAAARFDIGHCNEGLGTHFGIVAWRAKRRSLFWFQSKLHSHLTRSGHPMSTFRVWFANAACASIKTRLKRISPGPGEDWPSQFNQGAANSDHHRKLSLRENSV
jgi:hypothetical protein